MSKNKNNKPIWSTRIKKTLQTFLKRLVARYQSTKDYSKKILKYLSYILKCYLNKK